MRTTFALQVLFASESRIIYSGAMPTRRELTRATTIAQIKSAALDQIEHEGAPALSIRGVARAIGMSPAGLYRYYDGRDALLTDLLTDAYRDLAHAVARAAGLPIEGPAGSPTEVGPAVEDPMAAMLAAIEAYREWAVTNRSRFLLIFGTPVPGYSAPEDGPTVAANRQMGQVFFTLAAMGWAMGQIAAPPRAGGSRDLTAGEADVHGQLDAMAPGFPAELIPQMLAGWALWHGLVTLEVTGQMDWIYPDSARFYCERMAQWLADFTGSIDDRLR
jgi:AcrR family transcriptional regulator